MLNVSSAIILKRLFQMRPLVLRNPQWKPERRAGSSEAEFRSSTHQPQPQGIAKTSVFELLEVEECMDEDSLTLSVLTLCINAQYTAMSRKASKVKAGGCWRTGQVGQFFRLPGPRSLSQEAAHSHSHSHSQLDNNQYV